MTRPIIYSFRRCPYAMRARLAVAVAGVEVELREVLLRDKAPKFLETSPSATVPCLDLGGEVLDESFDIMLWALGKNDPEGWLNMPEEGNSLIQTADGSFKTALDRYKYASRFADAEPGDDRRKGSEFIQVLDAQLDGRPWLFGESPSLADMAILPFVRQFAHVDLDWFSSQDWPWVCSWLEDFKASERFSSIMKKYPRWTLGDEATVFP